VTHPNDPTRSATAGVRLDVDGPFARLTLVRPDRHNALDATDVALFLDHLDTLDADEAIRVLVLTGTGRATFCAGASLEQMESGEMSGVVFDRLTDRLAELRVPTICALNGSVYGGGVELALCCDFRIGIEGTRLEVPAARLGVCYPVGGLTRYVERLGLATANRILLAAEALDADEMLRVGYLTHRVPGDSLESEVDELASRLASLAPLAVQAMKKILLDVAAGRVDRDAARALYERCADSRDLKEGLTAHREGREPDFRGS
jgi:enoyl-CoA hydratase/carnithine racemase